MISSWFEWRGSNFCHMCALLYFVVFVKHDLLASFVATLSLISIAFAILFIMRRFQTLNRSLSLVRQSRCPAGTIDGSPLDLAATVREYLRRGYHIRSAWHELVLERQEGLADQCWITASWTLVGATQSVCAYQCCSIGTVAAGAKVSAGSGEDNRFGSCRQSSVAIAATRS